MYLPAVIANGHDILFGVNLTSAAPSRPVFVTWTCQIKGAHTLLGLVICDRYHPLVCQDPSLNFQTYTCPTPALEASCGESHFSVNSQR